MEFETCPYCHATYGIIEDHKCTIATAKTVTIIGETIIDTITNPDMETSKKHRMYNPQRNKSKSMDNRNQHWRI